MPTQIRIGLIGPKGAGKTTLAKRFADSTYVVDPKKPEKETLGLDAVAMVSQEAKQSSGIHQSLQREFNVDIVAIHELGGDERFRKVLPKSFGDQRATSSVDVVMLVADLSRQDPEAMNELQSCLDNYNDVFKDVPPDKRPPIMLIGARSDRYQQEEVDLFVGQQVQEVGNEFQDFAHRNKLNPIIFTSAKTGEGIETAFAHACRLALHKHELQQAQVPHTESFSEESQSFLTSSSSSAPHPLFSLDDSSIGSSVAGNGSSTSKSSAKPAMPPDGFYSIDLHTKSPSNVIHDEGINSAPPVKSIAGAIMGGFVGAVTSFLVHNPLFCLLTSVEPAEWKEWGALNIFRVLVSPIVNPLLALVDGLIEGGAMGYKGGLREVRRIPGETLNKAPYFPVEPGKSVPMKETEGTYRHVKLPTVSSVDGKGKTSGKPAEIEVVYHQAPTKFGRFFQLSAKLQTASEKRESEVFAREEKFSSNHTDFAKIAKRADLVDQGQDNNHSKINKA